MVWIRATATDPDGSERDVYHEAPPGPNGETAIGYLQPSGATRVNPFYAFAKEMGAPDESIRDGHRGVDGKGNDLVSDQRWVYDPAEAAKLAKEEGDRFIRAQDGKHP